VEALAGRTALSPSSDPERALEAFQAAREAGDASVLPRAREVAADAGSKVRLRMSAIAFLGELGEAEDAALLERLADDPESRIRRVAGHNAGRLRERLAAAGGGQ
jgi:HEAT repeat protein